MLSLVLELLETPMNHPTEPGSLSAEDAASRWAGVELPALPEAKAHDDARANLRRMTPAEQRAALVSAGIYNQDGTLTEPYRDG